MEGYNITGTGLLQVQSALALLMTKEVPNCSTLFFKVYSWLEYFVSFQYIPPLLKLEIGTIWKIWNQIGANIYIYIYPQIHHPQYDAFIE